MRTYELGYLGDYADPVQTWGYDGASWHLLSPIQGPPANENGGMVYDGARNTLVQFGGVFSDPSAGTTTARGQTWELADADHLQILRQPASLLLLSNQVAHFTLTVRGALPITYHWRKNGTNLVDASTISGTATGTLTISNADRNVDVGLYDVVLENACSSLVSDPATLAFTNAPHVDSISGGGTNTVCGSATLHASVSGSPPYSYQWRKDGTNLVADAFTSGVTKDTLVLESLRLADAGQYDVLVTDANAPAVNTGLASMEVLPKPWTLVGTNGPSLRYQQGMAYDQRRGVTVFFGGVVSGSSGRVPGGETWEWNGNSWSLRATNGPTPRFGVLMAYDSDRERTILFGGNTSSLSYSYYYPQETWEWDGTVWSQRASGGPPGRIAGGCAYDAAAHKFVVYGGWGVISPGSPGTLGNLFDTWEYDGTSATWTKVADGNPQPIGGGAVMAYDSSRNKRVLFCSPPSVYLPDLRVFEWSAGGWVEQTVAPDPTAGKPSRSLVGEAITYHAGRGLVIINNGTTGGNDYPVYTWGYDGTAWHLLSQNDGPHENSGAGMAYDSGRNALVEFGGAGNNGFIGGQTWELADADRVRILQSPLSTVVSSNQVARFSVTAAEAPPLSFQWRRNGTNLVDGPGIFGSGTGMLTISNANPVTDAGMYDVAVSND